MAGILVEQSTSNLYIDKQIT